MKRKPQGGNTFDYNNQKYLNRMSSGSDRDTFEFNGIQKTVPGYDDSSSNDV